MFGSHEGTKGTKGTKQTELEDIARETIDCGLAVHRQLGPGLLESVYESVLAESLRQNGLLAERQVLVPIVVNGIALRDGFRADLIVEKRLLIEVKSIERLSGVHQKQVLTYLRLMDFPLGLLMNFGGETFKDGLRRIANNYFRD